MGRGVHILPVPQAATALQPGSEPHHHLRTCEVLLGLLSCPCHWFPRVLSGSAHTWLPWTLDLPSLWLWVADLSSPLDVRALRTRTISVT